MKSFCVPNSLKFAGVVLAILGVAATAAAGAAEIKIGNTGPYSGPVSPASVANKTLAAFFKMVNDKGGVNGHTINFISLDDGYSPPRTVEQTRRLVEQDNVLFMLGSLGAPTQLAVQRYLGQRKVPQLFILASEPSFYEPKTFPYTISAQPSYILEGRLIGRFLAEKYAQSKVAILYQNDDLGQAYRRGLKATLPAQMLAAEASYEVTDPTIDTQLTSLKASGATILVSLTSQRSSSQAISGAYDNGWKPTVVLPSIMASIQTVLMPAGLEKATDVVAPTFHKDVNDPRWAADKEVQEYLAFMKDYSPGVQPGNNLALDGYAIGKLAIEVVKRAGDNPTRESVLKAALSMPDVVVPLALPGMTAKLTADDYMMIKTMQFKRFTGKTWEPVSEPMSD